MSELTTRDRKTSRNRLLRLAAFLEKVPKERFDYQVWVGEDWKGAQDLSCGTTACALGWATAMPFFRKLGLRFEFGRYGYHNIRLKINGYRTGLMNLDVATEIFHLSFREASFLFQAYEEFAGKLGPPDDATPKEVATHIRWFVKKYRAPIKKS